MKVQTRTVERNQTLRRTAEVPVGCCRGRRAGARSPPPSVVFTLFFIYFFLSQRLSPTIPTCLPREKRIAEGSQPHFHNKFVSSRDDGPPNAAHNKMAEGDEGEVEGGGWRVEAGWRRVSGSELNRSGIYFWDIKREKFQSPWIQASGLKRRSVTQRSKALNK